ncbi:DedA family protein [Parasporobacterium paucivorans]|uniref:Membrane protein DedA, SNARE-associated domain n=1 Tax=Parasporobacterium paucivorans DSM 15970 TaxID=1122934 RepID=A0A1M6CXJ7_9FIRM|nr:DedA family protein [Parasporobacterium paucivorans]SHI65709.1 membrane protein DedA, SNARE-associated domain [Parasporobacterium paucivorans DSM 15970]
MQEFIIHIMNQFGYLGIAFISALENVFPVIPSEVTLTFGGFMTTYSNLTILGVIITATIGSWLGSVVLYGIGRFLSAERLGKIMEGKIGRVLHLKKEDVMKSCDWFNSKGRGTVLICRCIPVVRCLISLPAGMAKMNLWFFSVMTIIGSLVWNTLLVNFGALAGSSWEKIVSGAGEYTKITVVVIGLAFIIAAALFLKKRSGGSKPVKDEY